MSLRPLAVSRPACAEPRANSRRPGLRQPKCPAGVLAMTKFRFLVAVLLIGSAAPARASVGASAMRLAFDGGAARYYPTYGSSGDPEIYAPISSELLARGLQFRVAAATAQVTSG